MKNNIILVGMMGAGKTFIGKALKETYPDRNFVDVDEYIENMKNMKIYEIFKNFGEEYFRNLETESLKDLTEKSNQIISVGGGAFEREENRSVLNNKSSWLNPRYYGTLLLLYNQELNPQIFD